MNNHKGAFVESGESKKEKQTVEGRIDDIVAFEAGEWKKILPPGVDIEDVNIFLKTENGRSAHYWHLLPELMENLQEAEQYKNERGMWTEE